MHWVYILKCEEDRYYVGETTRLYRRFWEHCSNRGGTNTSTYNPVEIVALYNMNMIGKFIHYNNMLKTYTQINKPITDSELKYFKYFDYFEEYYYNSKQVENAITECLMLKLTNNTDLSNVSGGKYTRFDVEYSKPIATHINTCLPLCNCGLPCDIRVNYEKNHLYFRCAKKNFWSDLRNQFEEDYGFEFDEPCKYFAEYTDDLLYRQTDMIIFVNKKELLNTLYAKSPWLKTMIGKHYEYCYADCGKTYDGERCITFNNRAINICKDCFIDKYDYIKKKLMPEIDLT